MRKRTSEVGASSVGSPTPWGTTSIFAAGTRKYVPRSRAVDRETAMMRCDRRAEAGHAVARPDRNRLVGDVEPRPLGRLGGLPVHERGQLDPVDGGQPRYQLAGVGLHAPGLAGNQEDQVRPMRIGP